PGPDSFGINSQLEFERNQERYQLLRWGQQSLDDFLVVTPETGARHHVNVAYMSRAGFTRERRGRTHAYPAALAGPVAHTPLVTGIRQKVNIECLSRVGFTRGRSGMTQAYADTLVGTVSHTAMVSGLGVLGWGVGGIEAEAAMLGQPAGMLVPQVIGIRLAG